MLTHKLTIKTLRLWELSAAMDGETVFLPLDEDDAGFTIEVDGPIYVTVKGQRFELQPGRAAWDAILAQVKW